MINGEGNFFEKRFGGMKKSCTFATFQQEQHLFKVANTIINLYP